MKRYLIVVAGGKGTRMGGEMPKQFQLLGGKPLVMVTLERLNAIDPAMQLILVLPAQHIELWKQLCKEHSFAVPLILAQGGSTRFHSVQNGLAQVDDMEDALVGVHDGVRPFVSPKVLDECFSRAWTDGAAIPMIDLQDSLRHIVGSDATEVVPRDRYRLVQTPQVFKLSLLRRAYEQRFVESFTDDASVVEALGEKVSGVEGNRENIKITTPFDMLVAKTLMEC
ncbi:MAG: 2-C-methyl-D-erythritol 4-phosphate cytidylyltransferase [Bacteroidaceae bacterium]|jgi:2-C-methyl-D-erythritol 4-phosphate cytidylyltransferase|nr:2-C-methyl-D-erythritol 4-phosphate cytidylyltransferase [Bacteroidaceae bacterium]